MIKHFVGVLPLSYYWTCFSYLQIYCLTAQGEMQGWTNDTSFGPFGGMGFQESSPPSDVEPTMQELGMPVMEIFVRKDSAGNLQRQACVVRQGDRQEDVDGDAKNPIEILSGGAAPSPHANDKGAGYREITRSVI